MESCFYEGELRHERLTPTRHRFHYPLCMAYLDLAELPDLERAGLISTTRFGLASFRRNDHVGDPAQAIDAYIRDVVKHVTSARPTGAIRVLTQLSSLGCFFSPLNLFYCFVADGNAVETVVAEVQNTPWMDRHLYVLWDGNREASGHRHAKSFHVSPFMGMNMDYRWRLRRPEERLHVSIENLVDDQAVFRAGLFLRRLAWTRENRKRVLLRYPLTALRTTAAIYWQAFLLWRKKCPLHWHPKHKSSTASPPCSSEHFATASCSD